MPSKLPDTSALVDLIQKGFTAERKFEKVHLEEVSQTARTKYHIPDAQAEPLARRALKAAIRTIRLHKWQPDLIRRMVQSQATVFRWQQGRINEEDYRRVQGPVERFVRHHLGQCVGRQLNLEQEIVCGETVELFIKKMNDPTFRLTSTLDTYLIGIAFNLIKSFGRRQRTAPANTPFTTVSESDDQAYLLMLERMRFYRKSHRLVAEQLGRLDDKCLNIIIQYYGIDPARVDAVNEIAESDEPMTEAEFETRFDVALGPAGQARKLKDIADDLGISPKKISNKHLDCVDRLVQKVIPTLLDKPNEASATLFAKTVRQEMNVRLAEAQERHRKKKLEKQRYANARRS